VVRVLAFLNKDLLWKLLELRFQLFDLEIDVEAFVLYGLVQGRNQLFISGGAIFMKFIR